MARRASSSVNPLWLVLAAVLVLVAIGGGYVLFGRVSDPYRTISSLPVKDYLDNANSLRGNVYKIDGTVLRQLEWSPKAGRLFSVDAPGGEVLPILVPSDFGSVNIERGQRFLFKIEVGEKGILKVQDVKKA
jgi:hypothetical protein